MKPVTIRNLAISIAAPFALFLLAVVFRLVFFNSPFPNAAERCFWCAIPLLLMGGVIAVSYLD